MHGLGDLRVFAARPSYVGRGVEDGDRLGVARQAVEDLLGVGGSSASKRGSYGVGRKRKSSPKALSPFMTEWWMLRATSTSASERSSASIRSTTQFEPLEPWTENIVRSAPWACGGERLGLAEDARVVDQRAEEPGRDRDVGGVEVLDALLRRAGSTACTSGGSGRRRR